MNINVFFIIIALGLSMIYIFFKPLEIKQQNFGEVASFNVLSFTMHELTQSGLVTLMSGTEATRYANRYIIKEIDYTDNSKSFIANMKADKGIYQGELVTLSGNVGYFREDGLTFKTQEATYNQKTSIATVDNDYIIYRDLNNVVGKKLRYNNLTQKIQSYNVTAKYQLKEDNK